MCSRRFQIPSLPVVFSNQFGDLSLGLLYLQLECPGGNTQGTMPQNDHLFQAIRSGNPYPMFLADLIGDPLDIGISSFGLLGVYHMNALVFFHRPRIVRDFIGVKNEDQLDLFECLEVCQNIHQHQPGSTEIGPCQRGQFLPGKDDIVAVHQKILRPGELHLPYRCLLHLLAGIGTPGRSFSCLP